MDKNSDNEKKQSSYEIDKEAEIYAKHNIKQETPVEFVLVVPHTLNTPLITNIKDEAQSENEIEGEIE